MPHVSCSPRRLLVVGCLLLVTVACSRTDKPAAPATAGGAPPGLPVLVATAGTQPLTDRLRAVGTLTANESVLIRSEIPGRVERIHFDEGQPASH